MVYTIPYRYLSAIVHRCPTLPGLSPDKKAVSGRVRAHQRVMDLAREKFGTVVPAGYDTILGPGDDGAPPEQAVREWLAGDYYRLHGMVRKIEGKDEYGVQVSCKADRLAKAAFASREIKELGQALAAAPAVRVELYRQKIARLVRKETSRLAGEWSSDFYERVKRHSDDVLVERTRRLDGGRVMLLNLSCLVRRKRVHALGRELEYIEWREGFSVRFTGPRPAYHFVARPAMAAAAG